MSESENTPIILNLAGALSLELGLYLTEKKIRVVDPTIETALLSWTHIFVRDLESFDAVGDTYGTLENDIKVICLSQPRDLQNFMMNNGKLVLDESWLTSAFGKFLLDKFFQEYSGVTLSDNYPKFRELGSFNIANPFNTGEYLDHLVFNAFENGMSALSIKTYFDHLLMFITSLKNKGRVGFPIEVSYGNFGDVYGLQMHFFSDNMQMGDVTNSLTSQFTKTPEEYLLYVALQSSDFFDFSYLPEVSKVVITGLWTKDDNVKSVNKGMMFSVASAPAHTQNIPDSSAPFVLNDGEIEDLSPTVTPAGMEEVKIIPANIEETGVVNLVSGGTPAEESVTVVSGGTPAEESVTVVSGGTPAEESVTVVSGGTPEEESVTTVKGSKREEDKTVTKISGTKIEKNDFKVTLSGAKEEKKESMSVKSLGGSGEKGAGIFDSLNRNAVKEGTAGPSVSKKDAPLFKVSGPTNREKELEAKLLEAQNQADELRSKLVTSLSELKVQKDTQARLSRIKEEAAKIVVPDAPSRLEQILPKELNKAPSEREIKLSDEFRKMERQTRKAQFESEQIEKNLNREIEKLSRILVLKDKMLEKTRDTFTTAIEKKVQDVAAAEARIEQMNKHIAGGGLQAQATVVKELERQAQNQSKVIEMHKAKISTLSSVIDSYKSDDENYKDEASKLKLLNDQMKQQLEMMKKELTILKDRSVSDASQVMSLKQERITLKDSLRKMEQASRVSVQTVVGNQQNDVELKRLQSQVQMLETYLRDSNSKAKDLEMKLQTATAVNRNNSAAEDGQSKGKINHLETSVKKLTQDLVESRNQMTEVKKEVNKLRQEKTGIQNLLDKAKKDLEKFEKKPATLGKKSA